ncbi:MAG TPA: MutS family DNA mismatch repair protein [Thermoanaerobacterium sp.]|nr:MutS family DNA mismatch repair protein [Thermoanaerobacterium sp.]
MKGVEFILELLYVVLIGGGLLLGFQVNHLFFIMPFVGIAIMIIVNRVQQNKIRKKIKEEIEKNWGIEREEKRNFESIRRLWDEIKKDEIHKMDVDDITWNDLDMDFIFGKLDHTMSIAGQQYLYSLFRCPLFDEEELKKRDAAIEGFMENKDYAMSVQCRLHRIGKKYEVDILDYLMQGIKINQNPISTYYILQMLSILVVLSPIIIAFTHAFGILLIIGLVMINGMIYTNTKNKLLDGIIVFEYMSKILKSANEIIKMMDKGEIYDLSTLKSAFFKVKKIYNNIKWIENFERASSGGDPTGIFTFINVLFLVEVKSFYRSINLINKYKNELFTVYVELGKLDAYIALASYKSSLKYYTKPVLDKDLPYHFKTVDIYHPLLRDPVPNSLEVAGRGVLLTGSNASGKSTFLKTVGINAIFAQTFYTVLAKDYSSSFFNVMTSIGTLDNIIGGDSYFMVEAKSLKRIIDVTGGEVPVLCILDEIFRGTNTAERVSAACEVLKYLANKNCFVVAATHDMELTSLAKDIYDNYHFEEEVDDNDVRFNYLLQKGPSRSRNAIKILRLLGYPEEIYDKAMNRANDINIGQDNVL